MLGCEIPELTRAESAVASSRIPTERWFDSDNQLCAYGGQEGDEYWFHLIGAGTYQFAATREEVSVTPQTGISFELAFDAYLRSVLPFVLQVKGYEVLHASAVHTTDGSVGLCATSGMGKSTLAYGLSQRGYSLWADDALVFETGDGAVNSFRLPFEIWLRPASFDYFTERPAPSVRSAMSDLPPSAPLRALFVLSQLDAPSADAVQWARLKPSEAFVSLLTHAYCFSMEDEERKQKMLQRYLALAAEIPVYDVRFQPGLAHLPEILDTLERIIHMSAQP